MADDDAADLTVAPPGRPEVDVTAGSTRSAPTAPGRRRREDKREVPFPVAPPPEGQPAPLVDERQVRMVCRSLSGLVGELIGDEDIERPWRFTADELDELVPPLTRYINRTPRMLVAMERGDELSIAMTLAGWGGRNVTDQRRARKARHGREREVEGAGAGAPAGVGGPGAPAGPGGPNGVVGGGPDGGGLR